MEVLLKSPITLALLAVNIALSVAALSNMALMEKLLFHVARVRNNKEWYRVVTSAFIHSGPLHLFLNMYALYIFGPVFELSPGLGPVALLGIYFGSLFGSAALEWLEHFRNPNYRSLGASGALSGLTLAFVMFAPMVQFSLFFVFPMPAFVFAIVYLLISAWASSSGQLPGIAHAGHLGGALAGIAIVCIFYPEVPGQMIQQIVDGTTGWF